MQRTRIVSLLCAGALCLSFGALAQQPQQEGVQPGQQPEQPPVQPGQEPVQPEPAQPRAQPEPEGPPPSDPPPAEQPQEAPEAEPFPEAAAEVSEEELDTFAAIYAGLMETASRFEQEIATAESVEEIQEAQERMRDESVAAIESEGWTLDKYNSIAQAINADPELAQEALRRIEEQEAG